MSYDALSEPPSARVTTSTACFLTLCALASFPSFMRSFVTCMMISSYRCFAFFCAASGISGSPYLWPSTEGSRELRPYSIICSWFRATSFSRLDGRSGSLLGAIEDGGGGGGGMLLSGSREVGMSANPRAKAAGPGCGHWGAARVRTERALHADQMFNRGGIVTCVVGSPIHARSDVAVALLG